MKTPHLNTSPSTMTLFQKLQQSYLAVIGGDISVVSDGRFPSGGIL